VLLHLPDARQVLHLLRLRLPIQAHLTGYRLSEKKGILFCGPARLYVHEADARGRVTIMADRSLTQAARQLLRHLSRQVETPPSSDAQLLAQFVERRDEDAFAELVKRHGPMVLGICRRILQQVHDAEDAFQATFLLLARKAATIRSQDSLASWLGRVACRVALSAREKVARQQSSERQVTSMPPSDAGPDHGWEEVCKVLDEELHRLPTKYHAPLLLCYLQGKTYEEATQELRSPLGTLKKRLGRARELLRQRLVRRGISLSSAALAALLTEKTAPAAVTSSLFQATVREAVQFAAGQAPVSASVLNLVEGAQNAMRITKIKLLAAIIVMVSVLGGGGGALIYQAVAARPPAEIADAGEPSAPAPGDPAPPTSRPVADVPMDPLPEGAIARLGTLRRRSATTFSAVAVSPDAKLLASADEPTFKTGGGGMQTIHLWDAASGREIRQWQAHTGTIVCLVFAPDGLVLASGGSDMRVGLWQVGTGKELHKLEAGPGGVTDLAFAPDGKTLAAGYLGGVVRLWDVAKGTKIRHFGYAYENHVGGSGYVKGQGSMLPVALSNQHLAAARGGRMVQVWELATGKEVQQLQANDRLAFLAFSPDGKTLATGNDGWMGRAATWLWSVDTGKKLQQLATPDLHALAFTRDGAGLYTVGNSAVARWDVGNGKKAQEFPAECRWGRGAFSAGSRFVVAGSQALRLWDTAGGKEVHPLTGPTKEVTAAGFLGPKELVTAEAGTVRIWDLTTRQARRTFPGHGFDRGPNGQLFIWDYKSFFTWDAATGKKLHEIAVPDASRIAVGIVVSPDGRTFATRQHASPARQPVRLYERATGRRLFDCPHDFRLGAKDVRLATVETLAFSPDSGLLATGSLNGEICLWSTTSGRLVRRLAPGGRIWALAFSPDGMMLAALDVAKHDVHLWETASWQSLGQLRAGAGDQRDPYIDSMTFSPDSRVVAVPGGDGGISLLDAVTLQQIRRLTGHRAACKTVAFAPDGKSLASGSSDTSVLIWDTTDLATRAKPAADPLSEERLQALWTELAGANGPTALKAIWELAAHPDQAVPFLRKQLKPASPVEAKQIAQWIAELDAKEFQVRQKAESELERLGQRSVTALRKALQDKPALEVARRIEKLLEKLDQGPPHPDELRAVRALRSLERIGTPEARDVLRVMAKGAERAWLTEEARAALERLERRQLAK
jgi:RNA polymerase sigma factor (sigma-70 family)